VTYALARPRILGLAAFAQATGMHPDLVGRLVALGLLEAQRDSRGVLWFVPSQVAAAARIQRLRAGFGVNYAALGLLVHLLDRIAELEAAARTAPRTSVRPGGDRWIRTD
jgi:chaperone modulatory protein CbpM